MISYFKNRKIRKQQKKEVLEIMKDFAEGRISTENFWRIFKTNMSIREILIKDKIRPSYSNISYYSPERLLDIYDANKSEDRAGLHDIVKEYFIRNKIKCNFYNEDANNWNFLQKIQPKWLYVRDEEFLFNMVNSAPLNLTKEQNKQWFESKIKELFKYDKEPPEWIQNPEWPIVNGKPLVFKKMIERFEQDIIIDDYIFYDEISKEEIIITQSDYR